MAELGTEATVKPSQESEGPSFPPLAGGSRVQLDAPGPQQPTRLSACGRHFGRGLLCGPLYRGDLCGHRRRGRGATSLSDPQPLWTQALLPQPVEEAGAHPPTAALLHSEGKAQDPT